jgi:bis(5'-nucleosidyl)-tetraphosphatase
MHLRLYDHLRLCQDLRMKGKSRRSFGMIPVRRINNTWQFLLLRAWKNWDFPKGGPEEDEDPWNCALRELEEETAIKEVIDLFDQAWIETDPYAKGKIARYYLVEVDKDVEVKFHPNPQTGIYEHHEFRWVNYNTARELLVPRLQTIIDWAWQKLNP